MDGCDAFEKREPALLQVRLFDLWKDIPPQYGPGNDGGSEEDRVKFSSSILGKDGSHLAVHHTTILVQPFKRGVPLPICVLEAAGLIADARFLPTLVMKAMEQAAASWLPETFRNGANVQIRGPRWTGWFQEPAQVVCAELADPTPLPTKKSEHRSMLLRVVCAPHGWTMVLLQSMLNELRAAVPAKHVEGVSPVWLTSETASVSLETCRWLPLDTFGRT
jgi:glutathione S-transferase